MKTYVKRSRDIVRCVVWTVATVSVWLAALASPPSDQNTVRVSSFGFDPLDSTRYIQAALDSGARTVVIDRQQGPWVVCPLFARSNSEIVLEEGVELVAKRGAFKLVRGNSLFSLEGVTNVVVRGSGSGATMRMWKKDYQTAPYKHSEWRHALNILSSKDIRIDNLRFVASGGDGIYLGVKETGCANTDVIIRNCVCSDNHRQGISVISAENLLIENVVLEKTCGTAPQAGIDLEPNAANQRLVNVVVRNCRSSGNAGNGFELYLNKLDDASTPISVSFVNCSSSGDRHGTSVQGGGGRRDRFARGCVSFRNCSFESSRLFGIHVCSSPRKAFDVSFDGCTVTNAGYDVALLAAVWEQGYTDGVRFENLRIHQPRPRKWLHPGGAFGPLPTDVGGSVTLFEGGKDGRRIALDDAWRAQQYRAAVNGGRPMPPNPDVLFPDEVQVEDSLPGELAELPRIAFAYGTKFVFYMAAPGRARFTGLQVGVTKTRPLGRKPYVIRRLGGSVGGCGTWSIPAVGATSTEFSFDAPTRGFYSLEVPKDGRRFALEKASVPVAVAVADCPQTVVALDEAGFDLSFVPSAGRPFAFVAGGSWYDMFGAEVRDPSGRLVSSSSCVDGLLSVSGEGTAETGFWTARFTGPFTGDKKAVLGLYGTQPCFFLSAAKRWR